MFAFTVWRVKSRPTSQAVFCQNDEQIPLLCTFGTESLHPLKELLDFSCQPC